MQDHKKINLVERQVDIDVHREVDASLVEYKGPNGSWLKIFLTGKHAKTIVRIIGIVAACILAGLKAPWFSYLIVASLALPTIGVIEWIANGKSSKKREEDPPESGPDSGGEEQT